MGERERGYERARRDGRALGIEAREGGRYRREDRRPYASGRAFSAKAAVKPAVSTNVRNIYLHELNPAYTL